MRLILAVVLTAITCAAVALSVPLRRRDRSTPPTHPASEPRLEFVDAFGGRRQLREWHDKPLLLSFVAVRPAEDRPRQPDLSRAQVVVMRSVKQQHAALGLEVVVVDASVGMGQQPTSEALLNVFYDWDFDSVPLLTDPSLSVARKFALTSLPTTLLLDREHRVVRRWEGFVTVAQITSALGDGSTP